MWEGTRFSSRMSEAAPTRDEPCKRVPFVSPKMSSNSRQHNIAVIPGDGIGIEVTASTLKVLRTVQKKVGGFELSFDELDYGSARYKAQGSYTPKGWLDHLRKSDAIFFGAVGDPDVPDHISLWELILPMRQTFQQYVNIRPSSILPGIPSRIVGTKPGDLDWIIVRENTEGEYAGQGGRTHVGTEWEVATELAVFTRKGVERVMRFAFETAQSRPKKLLTVVSKSNAQRYGLLLWDEVAEIVSKDFPDVKWDKMLVDAMTVRMVAKPTSLDTIVTTNLHGDILSDLAAGLSGSIGIAHSASLDPTRTSPSLFEPVHGAAFDIMGKDLANPIAAIMSAAEMLRWLRENEAADLVEKACKQSIADGQTTGDLGGKLKTSQVTEAVCKILATL
ncbi:tartrate dehydrogenase [Cryptococcus neoformans C23]|uniref:D-malate dehydrogenase (decarboxylating) n=2 Tax=Cryptococcus neoformans (strain H99 / ATCC 208821 / CBS 10515 / FGSC 9487) TaxID=235443 RepID=J9VSE7_CRYN9|nr:tartrate dehydrogenase [Cryptococcus neoformans var. grubii H99]AUB27176.1 tartrate dehydrogenase [Cryptococcus neoformans var. grubii]OWZ40844.1 tartrate dehydrogenase [Cryptococcus neoformans var. grubii C23]OXC82649.1 tartrate dehydrogenase [Cryptococcus neoformans var. grubii AD1-7a]AFR97188.2 tartrate dehydrogenase [Cryptococcus neoformans var. grubii H99]OXH27293.1 tartrate dehydrogenase [Cryptococcus neoformans var. grubii]|eukprot:XP_012051546.1 tartrate dehydrogenase [Cryptococcus neoformans var. grubii H99]